MKKLLIIALTVLTGCAYLQAGGEKVVESSGRQPKWVFGTEKEYIIVSAQASTIEDAKDKAMKQVKKQILESIADNVRSTSSLNTQELGVNGKYNIVETYESAIESEGALVPFLSEVSITKVEDSYWEKVKKDKNSYYYRYHLKYPFTQFDLMRMSDDFLTREKELDDKIAAFAADDFTSYSTIEEMTNQLQQLRVFKAGLMERDPRRGTCANVEKAYINNLKSITLRLVSVNRQELVYAPYYGEKQISTSLQPKLASNCLGNMQYVPRGGQCVVTYDYASACYPDEENYLEVTLTLLGNKIKNRFIVK